MLISGCRTGTPNGRCKIVDERDIHDAIEKLRERLTARTTPDCGGFAFAMA
jgi:hypothetical protein